MSNALSTASFVFIIWSAPSRKVAINVPLSRRSIIRRGGRGLAADVRVEVLSRRRQVGLVLGASAEATFLPRRCGAVSTSSTTSRCCGPESAGLIRFTSDYYHHPIGEVALTALPALLRQGKRLHPRRPGCWYQTDCRAARRMVTAAKRAPRQAELLEAAARCPARAPKRQSWGSTMRTAGAARQSQGLDKSGAPSPRRSMPPARAPGGTSPAWLRPAGAALHEHQGDAVEAIIAARGRFEPSSSTA